jgi:hypothetical protein
LPATDYLAYLVVPEFPFMTREAPVQLAFDRQSHLSQGSQRELFLQPFGLVRQNVETDHRKEPVTDQRPVIAHLEMIQNHLALSILENALDTPPREGPFLVSLILPVAQRC